MSGSVSLVNGHIDPIEKEMTPQEALAWVEDYEKAIKEEQAIVNNGDEFHVEALKVCEVVKQALEKQIPKKPTMKTDCRDAYIRPNNEIIKALGTCHINCGCSECSYAECPDGCVEELMKDALDLINRLQAENEELKKVVIDDYASEYDSKIRAEAIKEFAERLKDDSWFTDLFDRNDYPVRAVTKEDIDNLVKEMVGEDK